jgi:hypothetical protein
VTRDDGRRVPPGAAPLSGHTQIGNGVPRRPVGHVLTDPDTHAELVDALARGDESCGQLAARHGVTRSAIYLFRGRHAAAIDQRRDELGSRLADLTNLWLADKHARLRELEDIYDRIGGLFAVADLDTAPELARTMLSILHEAAEQLGQLPTRVQVQQNVVVRYELPGVDTDKL